MTLAEAMVYLARGSWRRPSVRAPGPVPTMLLPQGSPRARLRLLPDPPVDPAVFMRLPTHGVITSRFGPRVHPILHRLREHHGIDIAAARGTPVCAVAAGTVADVGFHGGYGLAVDLDHGHGTHSFYAHLASAAVGIGAKVAAGDPIGAVGRSGATTGSHLHFEIRKGGHAVNPLAAAN